MKSLLKLLILMSAAFVAHAALADTATQCAYDPVPTGWVATDQFNDPSQCNTPYPPVGGQANVIRTTLMTNIRLGDTLNICSDEYVPAAVQSQGYTVGPLHYDANICRCPYPAPCTPFAVNAYTITHQTCVAGQTNCYASFVTATPAQVTVPYGQMYGTGYASWRSPTNATGYIWVKSTYGSTVQTDLWTNGVSRSNVPWTYVRLGGTTQFLMSASSTSYAPILAASNIITGVQGAAPYLRIDPAHVIVPAGQTSGTFSMNWSAPGYSGVDIWGQTNNTGAWSGPVGAPATSSTGANISVGTTYTYRIYAPGSPGPNSSQPSTGDLAAQVTTYASH